MSYITSKVISENELLLSEVSRRIWENPELGFKEIYAHNLLTATLESFGFVVEKSYTLPTAFRAEFSSGRDGPTVAVLCEYDALPEIGHACGHNLIAEIGLAAGIAIKAAIQNDSSVCGKVVVMGTPAEESGGGKIKLIEKGAFKNVDVAMMAHPQAVDRLYPLVLDLARITVKYSMKDGQNAFESPNAVDAAVCCYNNIAIIRRCLSPKWRISGIIRNSSFEETEMCFSYRAPTSRELRILCEKLQACIESAAQTTGCTYLCDYHQEIDSTEYRGMISNRGLAEVFGKHARSNGIIFRDDDTTICESAVSTDMGNVSHVVPSIQPEYSIGAAPHVNHTPGFATAAGDPKAQRSTLFIADSLAKTAVDLMSNPELIRKVRTEFEEDPRRDSVDPLRSAGK